MTSYDDDMLSWVAACIAFDEAVRDEHAEHRPPDDVVPSAAPTPVDWAELRRATHGRPLRFRAAEVTADGVTSIDEPVGLALPDWPDPPKSESPE